MENNKNKKSVKFQGDMLIFCDFIQVYVFSTNHHLNSFKVVIYGKYISYLHEIKQTSYFCFILYSLQCKIEEHAV